MFYLWFFVYYSLAPLEPEEPSFELPEPSLASSEPDESEEPPETEVFLSAALSAAFAEPTVTVPEVVASVDDSLVVFLGVP